MPKILVVDDEPDSRIVTELWLSTHGYDVITASDGVEALAAIERECPDIVVTDYMMPRLHGVDLCRRVRQGTSSARLPIIMASAAAMPPAPGEQLYDAFLTKPIIFRDLLAVIRQLLGELPQD